MLLLLFMNLTLLVDSSPMHENGKKRVLNSQVAVYAPLLDPERPKDCFICMETLNYALIGHDSRESPVSGCSLTCKKLISHRTCLVEYYASKAERKLEEFPATSSSYKCRWMQSLLHPCPICKKGDVECMKTNDYAEHPEILADHPLLGAVVRNRQYEEKVLDRRNGNIQAVVCCCIGIYLFVAACNKHLFF